MNKVAVKYAAVLFENAVEKGNVSAVTEDVISLQNAVEISRELKLALENPVIKNSVKLSILKELFSGKVTDDFFGFLEFLVQKDRIAIAADIAGAYLALKDEHEGIVTVALTTSYELKDELLEKLKTRFEEILQKKVRFTLYTDESILGGFVAKVEDTVYDASIAHQLELLRKQFYETGVTSK